MCSQAPFKEYIKQSEPGRRDRAYAWRTAIGLQDVEDFRISCRNCNTEH